VLQAATIALLATAYLQEDGLLLAISFAIAILSLVVFGYLVRTSADTLEHLFGNRSICQGDKAELLPRSPLSKNRCFESGTHVLRSGCIVTTA
jgi:hypothetical protein